MVDSRIRGAGPADFPAMSEGPIAFPPGLTLLFLRTNFDHVQRRLDGNYFFDSAFNNCILQYDGGHSTSRTTTESCTRRFSSGDVKIDEPQVQELLRNFTWFGASIAPK